MGLWLTSALTLLLLAGFLAVMLGIVLFLFGAIDFLLLVTLIVAINFFLWLVGPTITDWMLRFLYKAQWVSLADLKKKSPEAAAHVQAVCKKHNFPIPKLGIIPDDNPNAFAYGSGRWNARLVATEGIFKYLDEPERMAVYSHELGHIKNRDFIIMTIAATIVELLYAIYSISWRIALRSGSAMRDGGKKGGGRAIFLVVAAFAFILYLIGTYVLLFLSRSREYLADRFSAHETKNGNLLASALIKIAYGIIAAPKEGQKSHGLLRNFRALGISDYKIARGLGLTYWHARKARSNELLKGALLFDIKNPWAFIAELGSTHPLTGKRIRNLTRNAHEQGHRPFLDFDKVELSHVDRRKLYYHFFRDLLFLSVPYILMAAAFAASLLSLLGFLAFNPATLLALAFLLGGIGVVIRTFYRYPSGGEKPATVLELMSDIYASPVRGRPVAIKGDLVGRGVPGYVFSEDMLMEDKTGLLYLNYESWMPVAGNLWFAWRKVKGLLGKPAVAHGWFLRSLSGRLDLKYVDVSGTRISSRVRALNFVGAVILFVIGLGLLAFASAFLF